MKEDRKIKIMTVSANPSAPSVDSHTPYIPQDPVLAAVLEGNVPSLPDREEKKSLPVQMKRNLPSHWIFNMFAVMVSKAHLL